MMRALRRLAVGSGDHSIPCMPLIFVLPFSYPRRAGRVLRGATFGVADRYLGVGRGSEGERRATRKVAPWARGDPSHERIARPSRGAPCTRRLSMTCRIASHRVAAAERAAALVCVTSRGASSSRWGCCGRRPERRLQPDLRHHPDHARTAGFIHLRVYLQRRRTIVRHQQQRLSAGGAESSAQSQSSSRLRPGGDRGSGRLPRRVERNLEQMARQCFADRIRCSCEAPADLTSASATASRTASVRTSPPIAATSIRRPAT